MPAARIAASRRSVFVLLNATAALAVGALACVPTVRLASSGGVRRLSAMFTRTSGVAAISPMLVVGKDCADAAMNAQRGDERQRKQGKKAHSIGSIGS